jgi:prephenate dehydrogenase
MTTLAIIGTGLIGASIGMRAREFGWRVVGFDARADAAEEAVRYGAIDEAVSREAIDERADVLVIAAHISGTIAELQRMRFTQPRNARLIIDIASVKAPIVQAARGVRNFVATHPMAVEFIGALGATPVDVDADEHDRTVAFTSHLPQVLATLFARRAGAGVEPYMGPTARELMRLSRSSAAMWHDILDANRENICSEVRALAGDLLRACDDLERGRNLYALKAGG